MSVCGTVVIVVVVVVVIVVSVVVSVVIAVIVICCRGKELNQLCAHAIVTR